MEEKCPKCGEPLITKTIRKELGTGSIEYPVAQVCPNCGWSRDLTGAGEIVSKPLMAKELKPAPPKAPKMPKPAPTAKPLDFNKIITVVLALLVLGGLVWAFYPTAPKQVEKAAPTPAPTITQTAIQTPAPTPTPEVTPTGKRILVKLDSRRGFITDVNKINLGDEIIWVNDGKDLVTLIGSDIPDFGTRTLNYDKRTSNVFKKPGAYNFYLKENANLKWTVEVI